MTSRNLPYRMTLSAAGVILLLIAAMHARLFGALGSDLAASNLRASWPGPLSAAWLVVSSHLVIVGALLITAAVRPDRLGSPAVALLGLVPAGDSLLLLAYVGVFPGSIGLGLAAVLVYLGLALRRA
jgi:hypothetical protein